MNEPTDLVADLTIQAPEAKVISDESASVVLVRGFQRAVEGVMEPSRYLKLGLCASAGGVMRLGSRRTARDVSWRKGGVFVTTPDDDSEFVSPDLDMIGIALDLSSEKYAHLGPSARARLFDRSSYIVNDSVVTTVMLALWTAADLHADTDSFVGHGVDLVIQRITGEGLTVRSSNGPGLSRRQLARLDAFVDARMNDKLRIQDLAHIVGIPEARFTAAIRTTTGLAPFAYLTSKRLERAKEMIQAGDSITQIAIAVGYSNPSKFTAAFKRFVGCTPTDWRRLSRG